MIIIRYDGTQQEYDRIVTEKTQEGYLLTDVANITDGHFLGFMKDTQISVINETPELLIEIRNNTDLILLKQEGIL